MRDLKRDEEENWTTQEKKIRDNEMTERRNSVIVIYIFALISQLKKSLLPSGTVRKECDSDYVF